MLRVAFEMKRHCDPRLSDGKQSHILKACVFNTFQEIAQLPLAVSQSPTTRER